MAVASLEGRRVRLRPPEERDLPLLFDWVSDPDRVAPFDRFFLDTFEELKSSIAAAPSDPTSLAPRFVVERKDASAALLGYVGFYDAHPVLAMTDLWYVLGEPAERGKGYGSEAVGLLTDHVFHTLPRPRVGATCDVANLASQKLLERLGFRREGTLTSALFHHSQWHDVAVYGVTRKEWTERARKE
ncbi:MAG TPA: GNAT family protein [Thermoplasmata archaeon]|nr:GNAT family protein [Thermoplasmata archaeon]